MNAVYKKENKLVRRVILFALRIFFNVYPVFFSFEAIVNLAAAVLGGLMIYLRINLFESVTEAVQYQTGFNSIIPYAAIFGGAMIVSLVLNVLQSFLMNYGVAKPDMYMYEKLHYKVARIDPVCYEDDELHDVINKARESINAIRSIKMALMNIIFFNIPYCIFVSMFYYTINPLFILIFAIAIFPVFIAQMAKTKNVIQYEESAAPLRRRNSFYQNAIMNKEFFMETRFLSAVPFFLEKYLKSLNKLNQLKWDVYLKSSIYEIKMNMSVIISRILIILILVYLILSNEISVAVFAVTLSSIEAVFMHMHNMVSYGINTISTMSGQAHNYIKCMEFPEREGDINRGNLSDGIVAVNMSFKYPHTKDKTIDNVSLSIIPGEIVAIVGENGAGKTTLAKLLIGMYKPDEGSVHLHGMDTKNTSMDCIFANTSAVFQNYMRYKMPLRDNITISAPDPENYNKLVITSEQASVDFNSNHFPQGYDTMLSREFGGVELSGGEWQRIAIARGIYRNHDIIVLDEPTAAIDPLEECRVYDEFCKISKGKTAIIITHRLGAAKIADNIIVMKEGKIISRGKHHELMKNCSYYHELFISQATWYK